LWNCRAPISVYLYDSLLEIDKDLSVKKYGI